MNDYPDITKVIQELLLATKDYKPGVLVSNEDAEHLKNLEDADKVAIWVLDNDSEGGAKQV